MAERKKPARGPTRAAALKALGLIPEDLETLKAVASIRDASTSDDERSQVEALLGHSLHIETEPDPPGQKQPAQGQLSDEDAARIVSEQRRHIPPEEPVWYMRNLRAMDVGFRLSRQNQEGAKRTNLKPRGQRGDMVKLDPNDLRDSELQTQIAFGLIEVIPEGEALAALKKQYTNAGNQIPPHIAMLRNERGEEYNLPVRTVTDEEAMGYKVADLDPGLMQGKLSDKEIKRDGGFAQNASQTPTGGNPAIISDGFMAALQTDMGSDNAKQAEVDARLRAKQFEDRPEDNLGVKVTVEPTQRVR